MIKHSYGSTLGEYSFNDHENYIVGVDFNISHHNKGFGIFISNNSENTFNIKYGIGHNCGRNFGNSFNNGCSFSHGVGNGMGTIQGNGNG